MEEGDLQAGVGRELGADRNGVQEGGFSGVQNGACVVWDRRDCFSVESKESKGE